MCPMKVARRRYVSCEGGSWVVCTCHMKVIHGVMCPMKVVRRRYVSCEGGSYAVCVL